MTSPSPATNIPAGFGAMSATTYATRDNQIYAINYVIGAPIPPQTVGTPVANFQADTYNGLFGDNAAPGVVLTVAPAPANGYITSLTFQASTTAGVNQSISIVIGTLSPTDGTLFHQTERSATVVQQSWAASAAGSPVTVTVEFAQPGVIIYEVRQRQTQIER